MNASAVPWRLADDLALLSCGPLEGRLVLDSLGVRLLADRWNGRAISSAALLATTGPNAKSSPDLELIEVYSRGRDLVAIYAQTPPHQISPQIYWRADDIPQHKAVRVEMILSMQTNLLDSDPQASVRSSGRGDEQLFHADELSVTSFEKVATTEATASGAAMRPIADQTGSHLFVCRNESAGFSYAQMVHPSDFVAVHVGGDESNSWSIESLLFPERLEKGVIRRARICGWFMPAENDLETAVELARRFVDEPLPLTT